MTVQRVLAVIVGLAQSTTGLLALILACLLHFNFFGVQKTLNVSAELLPLSIMILGIYGFFSSVSGLFLIHEH